MSEDQTNDDALDTLRQRMSERADDDDAGAVCALLDELRTLRARTMSEASLRERQAVLMSLARSEAVGGGDLEQALHEITEAAVAILGVSRSSIWRYDEDHSTIICKDLYRTDESLHEDGIELSGEDFPRYFEALKTERIIAAADAHTDPSTAEFSEMYLTPLGISSMLDAPVRVGGRMIGVMCNEHTGPQRAWSAADEQFARALADFTALAYESHERRQSEAELRSMVEVAEQRLQTIERQRLAIADLSAPIIDVWDGIVALPIVGLVDTQRSIELTERLLARIADSGASSVIVDLTGVDVVDTMTANHLLQMVRSASLLGAYSVLSGISPQIAQTLVQLDVDLSEIATVRNLKEGLKVCLRRAIHEAGH